MVCKVTLAMACAWLVAPVITVAAQKRALIVAVGNYADRDWESLNAANDAVILTQALTQHGFGPNLKVVTDAAATKEGFIAAFRRQLITPAAPGDILVLTFSGHGQRLSDDDGDESDGYDEALVLHDTPKRMAAAYRGQRHLRDDELNELLTEARRKVGPSGHLFVALDSCFSGGGGRAAVALSRGSEAFDLPAPGRDGVDRASGLDPRGADAALGSHVLISAAQSNEEAREAAGGDGKYYGSLSLALSRTLSATRGQANYFAVHDVITRQMAAWVRNRPQLEGDREQLLFSGQAIEQKPYLTVVAEASAGSVRIRGGGLHGILPGARIAFHPRGTANPRSESRMARGTVTSVEATSAVVSLTDQRPGMKFAETWAVIEEYSFGDIRTRVSVAEGAPSRAALLGMLADFPLVMLVPTDADVLFTRNTEATDRLIGIERATGSLRYADDPMPDAQRLERVRGFLRDFTRSTYLRKLEVQTAGFDVDATMTGCKVTTDRRCGEEISHASSLSPGGRWGVRVGDGFRLLLTSRASTDLFVSVLDISPENTLSVLYPPPGTGAQRLRKGQVDFNAGEFQMTEPVGAAMLKVIVTASPVTFDSIVSENWIDTGKGPLDGLFADALSGKAATPVFPTSSLAVRSFVYDVVP